jgi:hypothetical protein
MQKHARQQKHTTTMWKILVPTMGDGAALELFKRWFRDLTTTSPQSQEDFSHVLVMSRRQFSEQEEGAPGLPPDKMLDKVTLKALQGTEIDDDFITACGDFVAANASIEVRREEYRRLLQQSIRHRRFVDGLVHADVSGAEIVHPPRSASDPVEFKILIDLPDGEVTIFTVRYPPFGSLDYSGAPENADLQELLLAAQDVGNSMGPANARRTVADVGEMVAIGDRADYFGNVSLFFLNIAYI